MTESPPEAAGRWDLLKSIRSRQSVTVAGDNPAKKHSEQWNKEIVKVGSEFLKDVLWWKLIKTEKTPPSFYPHHTFINWNWQYMNLERDETDSTTK